LSAPAIVMRPTILNPLFAPVGSLAGVGPKTASALETLTGGRVIDLAWHLPSGVIDRRRSGAIADTEAGRVATLSVGVIAHQPPEPGRRRQPYRVVCSDATATLVLVFFAYDATYLKKVLPEGGRCLVSGRIEVFGSQRQMVHPDHILPADGGAELPPFEAIYPQTAAIPSKTLSRLIAAALEKVPDVEEWIDAAHVSRQGWAPFRDALMAAHAPEGSDDLSPLGPARARLSFDELLANQLALALVRRHLQRDAGRAFTAEGRLAASARAALGFSLTRAQEHAVAEIRADQVAPTRMLRLLHGDVGSGKTVVAVLAMLQAVESGAQAALMAPTEILARQHFATIEPLARAAHVRLAVLTGRTRGAERTRILAGLADGSIPLVVGTHALVQADVQFRDLGLAIIDEQHRFGVQQRLELAARGAATDILVMTATPIPRTLLMSAYGDMAVSRLDEKPPGRRPVDTRVLPADRLDEVVAAVRRRIGGGDKAYWVCPLVEESETLDVAAAEERYRSLQALLGERVGLLHGRMKGAERDKAVAQFRDGCVDLLVATTVIEVGVDVPAASVVVIEHAERFGLAQLHQLRGRVGRGSRDSTCLLLYAPPLTETARARLTVLRETDDGFRIAEEDLKLRGGGEILGTRQTGLPAFRIADLSVHGDLLAAAHDQARLLLRRDPALDTPQGRAARVLLHLFDRRTAIRYLAS